MSTAPNVSLNTKPVPLNANAPIPIEPIRRQPLMQQSATPFVKEGEVSRFTTADIPKYAAWLLPKLVGRWPQISAMTFSGWVMGWTSGNTFLFVKMPNAVGLCEVFKETPDLKLKAREVFVFCETIEHEDQAVKIYQEFKRWCRTMHIDKIRNIGGSSDLSSVRLRNNVNAKTDNGLMLEL